MKKYAIRQCFLICILLFTVLFVGAQSHRPEVLPITTAEGESEAAIVSAAKKSGSYATFDTSAESAIVIEKSTGRVLYEKNADKKMEPASCTKILTALTVLQNSEPAELVCVPREAVGVEGSSIYLKEGEHLTVEELLYGLMLQSGNDAAVALAMHVGGSVDAFLQKMNQVAEAAGAVSSHFATPNGLHDDTHYTTARDLANITRAALQNEAFQTIVSTKSKTISNEFGEYDRVLVNKNKLLKLFDGADGVKTGFTKKAGRCFVGSATRNGMQLICVVLRCGPMFEDTSSLLTKAFDTYRLSSVLPRRYYVLKGEDRYATNVGFSYPCTESEREELHLQANFEGQTPKLQVFLRNDLIFSTELYKINS